MLFDEDDIERLDHLRSEENWLEEIKLLGDISVIPIVAEKLIVSDADRPDRPTKLVLLDQIVLQDMQANIESVVLLGRVDTTVYVAASFKTQAVGISLQAFSNYFIDPTQQQAAQFETLRAAALGLTTIQTSLAAYAYAMVNWHLSSKYCGYCGNLTLLRRAGHERICQNKDCAQTDYPRQDAAVIVLIEDQNERVLLGRQQAWPVNVYSCIAGFVEPIESLENTVAREVKEETGLTIQSCDYLGSQSWPFPRSLMLAFKASVTETDFNLADEELEDASWFSREQIHQQVAAGELILPYKLSISRIMLDSWLNRQTVLNFTGL